MLGERSLLVAEPGDRKLVEAVLRDTLDGDWHSPEPSPHADSSGTRRAEFEQWCREVRDPAIEHSEGRRTICTASDEARLEYEIAPLPGGGWAVNWQYGFLGNRGGASQARTQLASREECLSRAISAAKVFFAVRPDDVSHQAACRDMQCRLTGGLFGLIEPEPVRDRRPQPTEYQCRTFIIFPPLPVSKEQFLYNETNPVFDLIEEASQRSGVSRGQALEDFLHMSVCAMSGGTMENQYLAVVERHKHGKPGRRGCDSIARAFGTLVASMEQTQGEMIDILGDLFQGAIT